MFIIISTVYDNLDWIKNLVCLYASKLRHWFQMIQLMCIIMPEIWNFLWLSAISGKRNKSTNRNFVNKKNWNGLTSNSTCTYWLLQCHCAIKKHVLNDRSVQFYGSIIWLDHGLESQKWKNQQQAAHKSHSVYA